MLGEKALLETSRARLSSRVYRRVIRDHLIIIVRDENHSRALRAVDARTGEQERQGAGGGRAGRWAGGRALEVKSNFKSGGRDRDRQTEKERGEEKSLTSIRCRPGRPKILVGRCRYPCKQEKTFYRISRDVRTRGFEDEAMAKRGWRGPSFPRYFSLRHPRADDEC